MVRAEACCESIDKSAEYCNLSPSQVKRVKQAAGLYDLLKSRVSQNCDKEQESPAIAKLEADKASSAISSLPPDVINEIGKEEYRPIVDNILADVVALTLDDKRPTKRKIRDIAQRYLPAPEIPIELYEVLLVDPPWRYEFSETATREIENQYPTMSLDKIKALKVPAADNSVLLLWATAPKLEEALQVISAWGFTYKTCAIWDKEKIGMGYWFRNQHELLLLGVRGSFETPTEDARFSSVIRSPRQNHSQKPAVVYKMIETMFPKAKKLELFARERREGWGSWGNEI